MRVRRPPRSDVVNHPPPNEYEALTAAAGIVRMNGRTLVELTGRDRNSFLHNFCTNDIRGLKPGCGCEAFITSVQGKILGHVMVFCGPESLVLDTVPGQAEPLIAHLDRYLIREEVALADRSNDWTDLLVAGSDSPKILTVLAGVAPPTERLATVEARIGAAAVVIAKVDLAGPHGFLVRVAAADAAQVERDLNAAGAIRCSEETAGTLRIESGWPAYGHDITDKNLPQEVNRDRQAISFTKGCYLGQETVARIDALGHVNRTLCGLRLHPAADSLSTVEAIMALEESGIVGASISADGQPVGEVTSATFSPRLSTLLALGYIRRGHHQIGTLLGSSLGQVEVITLPL